MSEAIRITIRLYRDDNPALYDDIARLPKGNRRVNRFRALATAALVQFSPPTALTIAPQATDSKTTSLKPDIGDLFSTPRG